MSQHAFSILNSSLLVRDVQGRYMPATDGQILDAARQIIDQNMLRGAALTSQHLAKDYLWAKLAGFESEVFTVLFLDTQHRLTEYAEMFHGTVSAVFTGAA
ncbi:hypothetical protein CWC46_09255 [Prodigiosinella confusarubida]|uniref:RadC-like JAB domain-containing protein n=1 Tax=Serratia sp. (strain ATCC 39006) TaxID=104623 RepID=A0A2I5TIA1_SERS3|nr:hypothetical protein CWC46_09255 [Serratia sp. ATCC 39006]AUH04293.1 hypothetical protein Ser39006_009260 [Serratia sp. ATCC 39006]